MFRDKFIMTYLEIDRRLFIQTLDLETKTFTEINLDTYDQIALYHYLEEILGDRLNRLAPKPTPAPF